MNKRLFSGDTAAEQLLYRLFSLLLLPEIAKVLPQSLLIVTIAYSFAILYDYPTK